MFVAQIDGVCGLDCGCFVAQTVGVLWLRLLVFVATQTLRVGDGVAAAVVDNTGIQLLYPATVSNYCSQLLYPTTAANYCIQLLQHNCFRSCWLCLIKDKSNS